MVKPASVSDADQCRMSNADLINRAVAEMIELERRVGKGGRITKLIDELLRLPERNQEEKS
jgi:hypothetical protein